MNELPEELNEWDLYSTDYTEQDLSERLARLIRNYDEKERMFNNFCE